jgi:dipeptidyl aminopeptidase/acylaminoacyl peptidase
VLYRVAFRRDNVLKVSLVTGAAMLAICLLALAETTNTAEAISLPKNGKIAFAGILSSDFGTTDNWEIYTVNPDGSELVKITNNPAIDVDPVWSPNGKKIAFVRGTANVTNSASDEDIYVMNADGTEQKRLTDDSGGGAPAWSPDGKKIAFMRNFDIYIMDADGGNETRLTTNARSSAYPSWSPDGTKIAFQRTPPSGPTEKWEIHTINVDGTGQKALTNNTADILPDWSPDGRRIVFNAGRDSPGINIMNADGTKQSSLHQGGIEPAWSPDGKKIVFVVFETNGEIAAINPDGSGQTFITSNPDLGKIAPDWQPLPRTVHLKDTGGPSLLWVASALLFSGGVMLYAGLKHRM